MWWHIQRKDSRRCLFRLWTLKGGIRMSIFKPQTKTLCCPKCGEVEATLETFTDRFDHELEWQEYICPTCEYTFEDVYTNDEEENR